MPNSDLKPDLASYEAACRSDPELQSFDSALHGRTSHLIATLAAGAEFRSLPLHSLRALTDGLLDSNQEALNFILRSKEDIWKNDELFDLVKDYFKISSQTLDFCASLENCLKNARSNLSYLQIAINQFNEDHNYLNSLEQFAKFKASDSPFSEEFFALFQSVYKNQLSLLKKLETQRGKLDKKLKSMKIWRRLTEAIFVTIFTTVLICSVVAAAVAAPPVVAALAAAASVPLGSTGKWLSSLWKKYESELKEQKWMISEMWLENYIVIGDLEEIKVVVERLGIMMEGLMRNVDLAVAEEEAAAVAVVVEEMKMKVEGFAKTVEELSDHSDKCRRDISRGRAVILQRIMKGSE